MTKDLFGLYGDEKHGECLRIPYKGSKNAIASQLLNKMVE